MKTKSLLIALLALALLPPVWAQDYEAEVAALVPGLADATVGNRYAAQMQLQALASDASRPGAAGAREALARVLGAHAANSATPQPARVWMVRQLELMGGAEAVPALTSLLDSRDAELRECARRALELNPAPAANASLIEALPRATDEAWRIGLIHSLGQRRDVASVAILTPLLRTPATAAAAAEALGNIAGPEAIQALRAAPASPAVADALIAAAHRCPPAVAADLYEQLLADSTHVAARAAALRGLARVAPEKFAARAPEFLASDDARLRDAAVDGCALSVAGTAVLKQAFAEWPPAMRVRALQAVATWDFETLRAQAGDNDAAVRGAALGAMTQLGTTEAVQFVVQIAASGSPEDRAAAQTALRQVRAPIAFDVLRELAIQGDPALRALALGVLAARNDSASVALFVACLRDPEMSLRRPALNALRQLGGASELEPVARFALATRAPEASETLAVIATRVTDKDEAANQLLALAGPGPDALAPLVEALAVLGGVPALHAVGDAAARGRPETREAAIAALGQWPDLSAAEPLRAVINDPAAGARLQSAALTVLVQLVRASENADPTRRESAILPALAAARQPAERKLVLSVLATIPTVKVAEALRPLLADPVVRGEAALAAISVAEGLQAGDRPAARALAQAIQAANPPREIGTRADKLLR